MTRVVHIACVVWCLVVAFIVTRVQAAEDAPAKRASDNPCLIYLPGDWWLVGNVDIKTYLSFIDNNADPEAPMKAVLKQYMVMIEQISGMNLEQQVDYVTFFAGGRPGTAPTFLLVVQGSFDNALVENRLGASLLQGMAKAQYRGHRLHQNDQIAVCLPKPSTLMLGHPALVKHAIDQVGDSHIPVELRTTLDRTDAKSVIWTAVRPQAILETKELAGWRTENEVLSRNLATLDCVSLYFTASDDGILVNAQGYLKDDAAANAPHAYLKQRKEALLNTEGANVFYMSFLIMSDVRASGKFVRGELRLTQQAMRQLWDSRAVLKK